ncbi:protein phosphatase 1 regulatory subunit 37 [Phlebotomus argentipes]|uniref:protein phosphatase 1 regulatory subunit 37 n=1 Tax=Phlebotomus argentipes TaxID=94469 RepID=UPI0028935837|nr:protein phosphatase 1 regulatory subunit 37 [Phlebotomus argentipes]
MDDPQVTENATKLGESAGSDGQQAEGVFASDDNREITGNNGHLPHRQRRQWAKARQAGTLDVHHLSSSRRVSFPKHDSELVTGYLEPANPWAISKPNLTSKELIELYKKSCLKHDVEPLLVVVKHLESLDFQNMTLRSNSLILRDSKLKPESCEALEEILKRIQYKLIDLTSCDLDDSSASAMFDMIEFYEAATELDISENCCISHRGWQACAAMIKKSQALNALLTSGTAISESNATNLGKALMSSAIHTLKLEHCGLTGRPLSSLCSALKKNTVLKELWLAHNDLNCYDAYTIGNLLKANYYLQFLDISNNSIEDNGVCHIAEALIKQSQYFRNTTNPISSEKAPENPAMQKFEPKKTLPPVVQRPVAAPIVESLKVPEKIILAPEPVPEISDGEKSEESADPSPRLDSKLVTIYEGARNNNNTGPQGSIPEVLDSTEREMSGDSDDKTSEDEKIVQSPVLADDERSTETVSEEKPLEEIELKIVEKEEIIPVAVEATEEAPVPTEAECPNNNSASDVNESTHMSDDGQDKVLIDTERDKSVNELCTASLIDINRNPVKEIVAGDVTHSEELTTLPKLCDEATISEMLSFTNSNDATLKEASVPTDANLIYPGTPKSPKCSSDMTPDSPASFTVSQSLDSSIDFPENSPSFDCVFDVPVARQIIPERSLSSESLNSETSIESNDSKSSIKLAESKFSKNGTLERQNLSSVEPPPITAPSGLQVLVLWNNRITKRSAAPVSDVLKATTTLEILNIGKNILCNDFVTSIKAHLITNTSLTNLGLQSAHLTCIAAKTLSEVLTTGPNGVLQRVDLRDNNIQIPGITALNDALKVNKTLTRLDLDNTLKRYDTGTDTTEYSRILTSIRAQCRRNEQPLEPRDPIKPTAKRARSAFLPSRKISLTCSTRSPLDLMCAGGKPERQLLDSNRKSGGRLRSPLPSPNPSPSASPVPSPSRSRFQVSRVIEGGSPLTPPSSTSSSPTNSITSSRFRVTTIKEQKPVTPAPAPVAVPVVATTPIIVEKMVVPEREIKVEVIDSPDMEVSRLLTTDDNSSIGSADSFDRHDINTSLSSTDSLDIMGSDPMVKFGEKHKGSVSSQESLSDSTQQESFCSMSSNENTLTSSVQLVPKGLQVKSPEKRVRKTSRTLAPNPQGFDKFLQIFQTPVAMFAQKMERKLDLDGQENISQTPSIASTLVPRRDSPIGELIARVTGSGKKEASSEDVTPVDSQPTTVLQANVSPDNTATCPEIDVLAADCIPVALKQEIKENISPEHTITAANVDLLQDAMQVTKVKFEVGSGDDDTETEEISQKLECGLRPLTPTDESHSLGQITRDSLSLLKESCGSRHEDSPSATPMVQHAEK